MKILAIIWKDTILRFADRSEILFFLVLPVVFTYLIGGGAGSNSSSLIPLLVVDEDKSILSREFVKALSNSGVIEPILVSQVQAQMKYSQKEAPAWLTIPQGFEAGLLEGSDTNLALEKMPDNRNADIVEGVVRTAGGRVQRTLAAANRSVVDRERQSPFASQKERQEFLAASVITAASDDSAVSSRVVVTRPEQVTHRAYDPSTQASAGQVITWVLIPLLGTSALFSIERSQKTLQRLVVTPTSKASFLLGTIAGQLFLACVQMAILIGFGAFVLGVEWGRSPGGLALIMISFGLASVALGAAMGTFVKSEKQANNLSIMFGMVLALLGGCWWPLELFPQPLQQVVKILPTTWAMQGFTDMIYRGYNTLQVLPTASVLVGFAVIFFFVGALRFRYE